MRRLELKETKGVTLVALVVAIIILIILAGVSISLVLGDDGILQKARNAKTNTEISESKELARMDIMDWVTDKTINNQDTSLDDAKVKDILTGKSYVKEAKESSFITAKGEYEIPYSELYISNNQESDLSPEIKYGYANNSGVVDADTLIVGDIINYYYDKTKSPIQCEIIYSDVTHGLQAISLDSVRNVELGFGTEDYENDEYFGTLHEDPKAIEAFKNGTPSGYTNTDFEKCRWSYNHAVSTLNAYAQDYLGDMAINARCVGSSSDNIILDENESNNMVTFSNYTGQFKDTDNNISGSYVASNGYTENISEDLKTLDSLGIAVTSSGTGYWLTSRHAYLYLEYGFVQISNFDTSCYLTECGIASVSSSANIHYGRVNGFRPIFTLKSDIKIEKIGHQNYGAGRIEEP